jgi:hypothetical protein
VSLRSRSCRSPSTRPQARSSTRSCRRPATRPQAAGVRLPGHKPGHLRGAAGVRLPGHKLQASGYPATSQAGRQSSGPESQSLRRPESRSASTGVSVAPSTGVSVHVDRSLSRSVDRSLGLRRPESQSLRRPESQSVDTDFRQELRPRLRTPTSAADCASPRIPKKGLTTELMHSPETRSNKFLTERSSEIDCYTCMHALARTCSSQTSRVYLARGDGKMTRHNLEY